MGVWDRGNQKILLVEETKTIFDSTHLGVRVQPSSVLNFGWFVLFHVGWGGIWELDMAV